MSSRGADGLDEVDRLHGIRVALSSISAAPSASKSPESRMWAGLELDALASRNREISLERMPISADW
jgi:hypothetical protein